jgi:NitT/TauT family transport system ATP-binding protein
VSPAGKPDRLSVDIHGKSWSTGQAVLGAIHFSLAVGEVVALLGPSGCGKSTLLAIIAGLDDDYQGRVTWSEAPRLSVVFQEPRLLPWRTATENVALAMGGGRAAKLCARAILSELGLAEALDAYPARLSLGMARRVALARALATNPEVLLLDEAFVSLDDASAEVMRQAVLSAVARHQMSVLSVSHDPRDLSMVGRVLTLGGTPARLLQPA